MIHFIDKEKNENHKLGAHSRYKQKMKCTSRILNSKKRKRKRRKKYKDIKYVVLANYFLVDVTDRDPY